MGTHTAPMESVQKVFSPRGDKMVAVVGRSGRGEYLKQDFDDLAAVGEPEAQDSPEYQKGGQETHGRGQDSEQEACHTENVSGK